MRPKLFAPNAIAVSTLLFTPLVGGTMAAANWLRTGDRSRAWITLLLSAAIVALFAVAWFIPNVWPPVQRGTLGAIVGLAIMLRLEQKRLYEWHLARGAERASAALPAFVGLGFWVGAQALIELV